MNTITQIVFVMTLWLVMGIGFLSAATEARRKGKSWGDALLSIEGLLFFLSLLIPIFILIHRNVSL